MNRSPEHRPTNRFRRHDIRARRILAAAFASLLVTTLASPVHAQMQQGSDLATVSLKAERSALVPGETNWIAVHFAIEPMWHLYWKNPGDSGQPPFLKWDTPDGVSVGEPLWPAPLRHVSPGDILDYTYDHELALLVPVTLDRTVGPGGSVTLTVNADFLICKDVCLFGNGSDTIALTVASEAEPSGAHPLFERTRRFIPREADEASELNIETSWSDATLRITVPGATGLVYFPERGEGLADAVDLIEHGQADGDTLRIPFDDLGEDVAVHAVLTITRAGETTHQTIRVPTPGHD